MNSRAAGVRLALAIGFFLFGTASLLAQGREPWTEQQLKDPAVLAKALKDPAAPKPVIFNIGPAEQIKGAIRIGPTSVEQKLDLLKEKLAKVPKDKEVIIYCGCCPFSRCPNVRPAFELLKEMKFKNAKLLNTPVSLKEDWISRGYPME